jgi:hypothetical protein
MIGSSQALSQISEATCCKFNWLQVDFAPANGDATGIGEPVISGFQGGSEIICKVLKINIGGWGVLIKSLLGEGTDRTDP